MKQHVSAVLAAVCVSASAVQAEVVIETVSVGNPRNAADTRHETPGYGSVDYAFSIGKFEVTAGQYTEFLNAVANDDTYLLYSLSMWTSDHGCKIERTGSSPDYSYSVAGDWADRPVNFVSWGDAARFANWLHNGQPTGVQDLSTTEDGSYYLNGVFISNAELLAIVREPEAIWVIPSEDEWYKAAYDDDVTGNYYDYPTRTDATPSNDLVDSDPGNNATFYDGVLTIGDPYFRTEVGAHVNSESPYGTFDQGGNVWEWNEATLYGSYRGVRGGSFSSSSYEVYVTLQAATRSIGLPNGAYGNLGFRVADVSRPVPEDLDHDGDVDLRDYALFQAEITGPR
jgi:formylglycine-generating enzyme required for sulfatase activity